MMHMKRQSTVVRSDCSDFLQQICLTAQHATYSVARSDKFQCLAVGSRLTMHREVFHNISRHGCRPIGGNLLVLLSNRATVNAC